MSTPSKEEIARQEAEAWFAEGNAEPGVDSLTVIILSAIEKATVARYGQLIESHAKQADRIHALESRAAQPQEPKIRDHGMGRLE